MFSQSSKENDDSEFCISPQWKNFNIYDAEPETTTQNENHSLFIDDKAMRIMQKMGYKSGSGLGKNEQGITEAIEVPCHLGKRGLGLTIKDISPTNECWDFSKEEVSVRENVVWLQSESQSTKAYSFTDMSLWIKEGKPNHEIENESNFCDKDVLDSVLKAKNIFDELNLLELCHARTKANPFETIKSVFFMNRAALKMANIDAATEFMFSNIDQNTYHNTNSGPYYFADVCAGPGGFSEYILWRKSWRFKGFGLTLRDINDFKLQDSMCASPVTFQALYGKQGDGNVCCPENVEDFRSRVLHETDGKGVHFMMSDGGFSVEGNENIQEILSKNIYACQCLVALEIIRPHGHFVTKLFDLFTPFSVGLLYLMYKCFEKVTILKPNSSRPANSERYFICHDLREGQIVQDVKKYLWVVAKRLWELKDNCECDVLEIVPLDVIKGDAQFFSYIVDSNNSLGKRQTVGLEKLAAFCRNTTLIETRQEELRKKCLEFWKVPDLSRIPQLQLSADELLNLLVDKPEILLVQPRYISDANNFKSMFSDVEDWHFCRMYGSKRMNNCCFYAAVGASKVYRLQRGKWVKVKNLQLIRGTLLYGELVKEWNVFKKNVNIDADAQSYRQSLHIIDALRLGDKGLSDLKFKERMELLQVYCKSINRESTPGCIRVRPKVMSPLSILPSQGPLREDRHTGSYMSPLPVMGYNVFSEMFNVNSLLLLKTNENQYFHSSFVLRVQVFVNSKGEQNDDKCMSLKDVIAQLKGT